MQSQTTPDFPGPYREGGSIIHDGAEYDFDLVMSLAEKLPSRPCAVDQLAWVLEYDTPLDRRVLAADISVPLIVATSEDGRMAVIDGLHRLTKAAGLQVKSLQIKYIPMAELESARLTKEQ